MLKNIIKIYNNFLIFPNNHLINERDKHFGQSEIHQGENYILDNHFDINIFNDFALIGE